MTEARVRSTHPSVASPAGGGRQPVTVWLVRPVQTTEGKLRKAIRSHTRLDVRILSEAGAALPGPQDMLVVDPALLRADDADEVDAPPASHSFRGGLAPHALGRVKAVIEERLAQGVALAELASMARLSACHFARAFKQSVGCPPHQYLLQRRLRYALELIRESERPLTEIALCAGFSDQSHFTRFFVRHMGETPSAYRRRHR